MSWGDSLAADEPCPPGGPLALVLTHRRGSGVVVARALESHSTEFPGTGLPSEWSMWFERLAEWSSAFANLRGVFQKDSARVVPPELWLCVLAVELNRIFCEGSFEGSATSSGLCFSWSIQPSASAESLWSRYRFCLAETGLTDRDINRLALGTGPVGSFTGLRIGASFCSGLVFGRPRSVASLETFSLAAIRSLGGTSPRGLMEINPTGDEEEARILAWDQWGTDYSASLGGIELTLAVLQLAAGAAKEWSLGEVGYAALPGPVIKLQQKMKG